MIAAAVSGSPWLSALPPFLIASAVCIAAVPGSMWLAKRTGAMAQPDDDRHLHPRPTPRLGGLALYAGFAVAIAIFGSAITYRWQVVAVTGAITLAMAVDDILDLNWLSKLGIEIGVGVLAVVLGIAITSIAIPGSHTPSVWELGLLAAPVTVVWLVGMQISVNLLDGADGVAAGVVAIVAGVCLLAAINRIQAANDVQSGVVILSGAVMGCCLGFLVFNLPPARVFMGDSGSHFLGIALGAITILGVAKVVVGLSILVPLIALGLPDRRHPVRHPPSRAFGAQPGEGGRGSPAPPAPSGGVEPHRDGGHLLSGHRDPRMPGAHHLRAPPDHRSRARAHGGRAGRAHLAKPAQGSQAPFRGGH